MKKTVILIRNAQSYDFGGGERFPVFLAGVLRDKHHYRSVIVSRHDKLLDLAHSHSLPTVRGWWWSQQNWSGKAMALFPFYVLWQVLLFFWYLQLFIRTKADIIHIQSKDDFIAATFAGSLLRKLVIWTDHADLKHILMNTKIWYKNPSGKFVYLAAHFAHVITVVSNNEKQLIQKHIGVESPVAQKLTVIYNGAIDTNVDADATTKTNIVSFCVASRLVQDKGIAEVIEAFVRLEKKYPKSELRLIGDGPEADLFKEQAAKHSKIHFLGHQKQPLSYIANSTIFVHPTYHEGFSVALVEASMLSRPIIATSVGGNVEIIHDHQTGLLVHPKNVDSLFEAMELLYKDKSLRDTLGENARKQFVQSFEFTHIVKTQFIPIFEGKKI